MSEINELYQKVILDHFKNPQNFQIPVHSDRKAEGYNPVCGDQIIVYVRMEQDTIREIGFQGSGCAISKASASMMTEYAKGKSMAEIKGMHEKLMKILSGLMDGETDLPADLNALSGVRQFPVRVKCAILPWQTLTAALENKPETATTE